MKARGGDRAAYGQIVVLYQDRPFQCAFEDGGRNRRSARLNAGNIYPRAGKIESFRGESSPYTWIFRIGMNLAISNLRRSSGVRVFSLDGTSRENLAGGNGRAHRDDQAAALVNRVASAKGDTPPQAAERRERNQMVLDALSRLDAEYRAVLIMRDVEAFDYQQMAEVACLAAGDAEKQAVPGAGWRCAMNWRRIWAKRRKGKWK